ncbi:uncharacterized protein LOC122059001 [Macadamia integrifolia]|uniref:uncharacterized protein LOC122059001 n=1 Tax=Macadamia integrifolia TaxID=60698 RepID=UPI001C52CC90|nr:uncharacterized protein LOC122059001 [Macadamia integrifolia]
MVLEDVRASNPSTKGEVKSITNVIWCRKFGILIKNAPPQPILDVCWCRPQVVWVNLNFDGSSIGNSRRARAGGLFHDHSGKVLDSYKNFMGVTSVFQAKLEGLMVGLLRAHELAINQLWVETDSRVVVISFQQKKIPWYALQRWIYLQPFLEGIEWKITHNFREANSIADYLARDAAKIGISGSNIAFPGHVLEMMRRDADGRPNFRFG